MARLRKTGKVEAVQKAWLSKDEAMAYLGVSADFLRKLRQEGQLSYSRYDNMIWYQLESINTFLHNTAIQ